MSHRVLYFLGCTALAWLAACGAYAADSWDACCDLILLPVGGHGPPADQTIVGWQRETRFTADGFPGELVEVANGKFVSWKRRQIAAGFADYLRDHPTSQAQDYFRNLGMACAPREGGKDVTRCDIEIPIEFECEIYSIIPAGVVSLPEQLRGRFGAILRMRIDTSSAEFQVALPIPSYLLPVSVDASTKIFISTYSQVLPLPGGHLCTR